MKNIISIPENLKLIVAEGTPSARIIEQFKSWLPEDLKAAAEKRRIEFILGRYCAFKACEELGYDLKDLERGTTREPLWPDEVIGSISHTNGIVMALVGLTVDTKAVGIDIEGVIEPNRFNTIERMVLTDHDKNFLEENFYNSPKLAEIYSIIFSAKEALFKLLYPTCKCYFDFREADIQSIDLVTGEINIKVISKREEMKTVLNSYKGHFSLVDNRVISFFYY
jgi:4'-phosphopantetheinyl transferase EntD